MQTKTKEKKNDSYRQFHASVHQWAAERCRILSEIDWESQRRQRILIRIKDIYVAVVVVGDADIARIWLSLQLDLIKSGITHQWSFGGWPRNTYDDTWNPFRIFGVTHKKKSFLNQKLKSLLLLEWDTRKW